MRYFAYGSNMDPSQMSVRCPGAVALGPARLADHRLAFRWDAPGWGGGVADVEGSPGDDVWGVLWEITADHVTALDEYEGVADGVYGKRAVAVEHAGRMIDAFVYVMDPERARKAPSKRYLGALIRGARAHDLPGAYVERLRALRDAVGGAHPMR